MSIHFKNQQVEIDSHLYITHLIMRILGCRLLDFDTATFWKGETCIRIFVMSAFCFSVIPAITAMAEYIDDLHYLSEISSNVIISTASILFLFSFYYLEEKYGNLLREIRQEFWTKPLPPVLFEHFQIFERISTGINIYLVTVGSLALLFYCSVPLWANNFNLYTDINAIRRTPLIAKYYYDQRVSPNYEITYLCQITSSFFIVNSQIALTSVYAFICMHLCAKLRIFQVKLNLIGASTSNEEFAGIIREHQYLIRFANDVEKLYSPILLFYIVFSTLLICLNVITVTTVSVSDSKMEFLLFTLYFAATFSQIFVFCWMANEIFTESEKLSSAAYCSEWYAASKNIRRGLLLFITRAQRPNVLTAGKFFPVTLATFGSVCSTAVSYYTLLKSIE